MFFGARRRQYNLLGEGKALSRVMVFSWITDQEQLMRHAFFKAWQDLAASVRDLRRAAQQPEDRREPGRESYERI